MASTAKAPQVNPGQIALMQANGRRLVLAELGQQVPQISDGFGGWQTVDRTGRTGLTWWQGRNPAAVVFSVYFDERLTLASIEASVRLLESLAGVGLHDDQPPPTIVFNAAGVVPLDQTDPRARSWLWTITGYDPQDAERSDRGSRYVGEFNLTLTRSVTDATLKQRSEAATRKAKKKTKPGTAPKHSHYVVKTGDTLVKIAAKEYGDVDRWPDIAKANHLRDPRAALKPGRKLRLPK